MINNENFNFEEAENFLYLLENGGKYTFQTLDDKKYNTSLTRLFHGTLDEHLEDLQRLNQKGAGIFVVVNETDGKGRKASNVTRVRAHFIDSDDRPIKDVTEQFQLTPHIIVESSEGKGHAYYKVHDTSVAEFKGIQKQLSESLGTDGAVCDPPRTMRLPGFFHMKGEPRLVKIIDTNENQEPYSKEDILSALPKVVSVNPSSGKELARVKSDSNAIFGDGQRTQALVSMVGRYIARGVCDSEVFSLVSKWNIDHCDPPLSESKLQSTIESIRKTDNNNHPERYGRELLNTESGNAKRFVGQHGENLRYSNDREQWLLWDGKRWVFRNNKELIGLAQETAISIFREAELANNLSDKEQLLKWSKTSLSAKSLNNMISLAQSEGAILTSSEWLDRNDWLLNLENGTIDLKDCEFREHNRSDLLSKIANVSYFPEANCPKWLSFLDVVFNKDKQLISWLQKVVGYTLTGSVKEQCMFMLIGEGCNGKSTFLNTLKHVLGDYGVQAHPDTFMASKYSTAGSARSDLVRLIGSRMVTAAEGEEGQRLAESLLKQVTGGELISTRGLYQKAQIEFLPKFKFFLCSNHKPVI